MRILTIFLAVTSCASPTVLSASQVQRAARFDRASTHYPCAPNATTDVACVDDQGIVWSACAWNSCGIGPACREEHQRIVMAGSCGEPEWPACN